MGTDSASFGPGILYAGSELHYVGHVIDKFNTTPYELDIDDTPAMTFKNSLSQSIEFELESELNVPVFNELVGELSEPKRFYMEYDGVRYEQIRKHKKKRINKKWAKRYGYREVPCRYRVENCYISPGLFNDFEIISDPVKIVRDIR